MPAPLPAERGRRVLLPWRSKAELFSQLALGVCVDGVVDALV